MAEKGGHWVKSASGGMTFMPGYGNRSKSGSAGGDGSLERQIAAAAREERQRAIDLQTRFEIGSHVDAYIQHPVTRKTLRIANAKVWRVEKDDLGGQIAFVRYTDAKGMEKSTWLSANRTTWKPSSSRQWNKRRG